MLHERRDEQQHVHDDYRDEPAWPVGRRATQADEVDDAIIEMIETPRPFILDMCVDQKENCFPMIPSGAAHNEMLLGPGDRRESSVSDEGMVLV